MPINPFENVYESEFMTLCVDSLGSKFDFLVKGEFTNKRSDIAITLSEIDIQRNEITGRYVMLRVSKKKGSQLRVKNMEE